MKILLHPAYFPNCITFATLVQHEVVWEVMDNYQKQTYRNRCYICTDQGRQMMNIPIRHVGGRHGRQEFREVKLENGYPWQRQHWRTLQTAYRGSPFFEFYEDDLAPLYQKEFIFLLDFNLHTIEAICRCLQLSMPKEKTCTYQEHPGEVFDGRFLINAKETPAVSIEPYHQVFGDRHGFIKNLSVLDLLFNLGTSAVDRLEQIELGFGNG